MNFGIFTLHFDSLILFFTQPLVGLMFDMFAVFGWLVIVYLLLYAGFIFYIDYRESKGTEDWEWVLLAIDIPQMNMQTPMAVEQLFSHLAGAYDQPGIRDIFYRGFKQRWFSFEIISIEGYIQFLIRTEKTLRDLVEASVYAQYPQADITLVEDYVSYVPDIYPNDTHDVWIADFATSENDAFPIRSYREFEHNISKDTVLKDPMGTFLESFSRISSGEQMWFQIIIQPIGNKWKEDAIKKVKELIGDKSGGSKSKFLSTLRDNVITKEVGNSLNEIVSQLTGGGGISSQEESRAKADEPNNLRYMTPGQMKVVEAIETKINKIGLKTKMRAIYIARKEVFQPERGIHALIGAINQFNVPTANSIVPVVSTSQNTKRQSDAKKNELMKAYKKRKINIGGNSFVLNIEELATVWHFPMSHVSTPMLQMAQLKTSQPPSGLPVERLRSQFEVDDTSMSDARKVALQQTYKTDSGEVRYTDDNGGVRFG